MLKPHVRAAAKEAAKDGAIEITWVAAIAGVAMLGKFLGWW